MTAILDLLARRQQDWTMLAKSDAGAAGQFARGFASVKGREAIMADVPSIDVTVDEGTMTSWWTVSTPNLDREGDSLIPAGCLKTIQNYKRNPVVLHEHNALWPVGISVGDKNMPFIISDDGIRAGLKHFTGSPMGRDVFEQVKAGILRCASIAFLPLKAKQLGEVHKGSLVSPRFRFDEWDCIHWATTTQPQNPEAVRMLLSRGKIESDYFKKSLAVFAQQPKEMASGFGEGRWNKSLSKAFDVAVQVVQPLNMTYEWVSKFLECPVKKIHSNSECIPSPRMGSFLTGLRKALLDYEQIDVRALCDDREKPPHYENIQLNSKSHDTFLVRGTAFYKGKHHPLVINYSPNWNGIDLTFYVAEEHRASVNDILEKSWTWAKRNNFLKGEAFALCGEFLEKTNETFDNLFLDNENDVAVKRILKRFNEKGENFANHGAVLSGPPGTGKTLSARILLNQAKGTYIWVSAKDFDRCGNFALAFELAKELTPTVLVFEDIDNYINKWSVDYLKAEMDGVARSKGLLTIITTNFPEKLPEALLDRPGRFHDVLQFGLPSQEVRRTMLSKWLGGMPNSAIDRAVAKTDGYSGAHLYHLCEFAKSLQESEEIDREKSLTLALEKLEKQKDIITGIQLEGSRYRPSKSWGEDMSGKINFRDIQAVRLSKAQYPKIEDAQEWCKSVGFDCSVQVDRDKCWEFTQHPGEHESSVKFGKGIEGMLLKSAAPVVETVEKTIAIDETPDEVPAVVVKADDGKEKPKPANGGTPRVTHAVQSLGDVKNHLKGCSQYLKKAMGMLDHEPTVGFYKELAGMNEEMSSKVDAHVKSHFDGVDMDEVSAAQAEAAAGDKEKEKQKKKAVEVVEPQDFTKLLEALDKRVPALDGIAKSLEAVQLNQEAVKKRFRLVG